MTNSALSLRVAFITWNLLYYHCMPHTIDCTTTQCQHTIIDCLPNQNCFVSCEDSQSCIGSVINCPLFGYCIIICRGGEACQDTIIDASSSNGNFNLLCDASADTCKGINIYGSTLATNSGHFTVTCSGAIRSCVHSEIHCHRTGDCSISCNGDTSCRWSQITGPSINGQLNIECNGKKSCFDAILDGRLSSSLDIRGCTASGSCLDLTLYCPPNTDDRKNCFIEGNNNIGEYNNGGTKIYAIHGFEDIDIDYSGSFGAEHNGKMFCGNHYDRSCNIATDSWSCNDDEACNASYPTTVTPASLPTKATIDTQQPIMQYTANMIGSIHSTDSILSQMAFNHHPKEGELLSWTAELKISFILFVIAMLLLLGLYCCKFKITDRNLLNMTTNYDVAKQSTPEPKADVKCVPIEEEHDDKHTVYLNTPNNDMYRYTNTDESCVVSRTESYGEPSIIMFDAISVQTDTEQAIRRPSISKESNMTNLSQAANASITDINQKNILFLNPMDINHLYISRVTRHERGENGVYDGSEYNSDTEISIQTNSSETSVDTNTSTESFPEDVDRDLFYSNS